MIVRECSNNIVNNIELNFIWCKLLLFTILLMVLMVLVMVLSYLDLCYVNLANHKLKTFPLLYIYRLWTNQKLQKISYVKSSTFGGNEYFAAVGTKTWSFI